MDKIKRKLECLDSEQDKKASHLTNEILRESGLRDLTLRDYQLTGVNWLTDRFVRDHGCIIADEMGLGKTCQTISFLLNLRTSNKSNGPFLILAPLSVLANWQSEMSRFAPGMKFISYVGDKDRRLELRDDIRAKTSKSYPFDVLLTTYEICLNDGAMLSQIPWEALIVDEGHRVKNSQSKLYQLLEEMNVRFRMLLTGTPIQNNLQELYSLLRFVCPRIFREKYRENFIETYSSIAENSADKHTGELRSLLKPFILRRVKSEVVKDLPNRSDVILHHDLSKLQKKYYKAILMKDTDAFSTGARTRLMNILAQLRKCVDHPYLFDGVEPEPFEIGEHLVKASGKLVLLDRLLTHLKKLGGHKVLLFSQMTHMLDILQDYCSFRGFTYERLDGSVRGEERYLAVRNFNADDDVFCFLLSTKAGGVGLNLVGADTVIFYDSDFNPQNDLQAAARAHRIGQTRPVKVIRLIARDTVEEIILGRAEAKLKLTTNIMGDNALKVKDFDALVADSNAKLSDILKFGAEKILDDDSVDSGELDVHKVLGASVDGVWQVEETTEEPEAEAESLGDAAPETMYTFEGKDYAKETSAEDKKAFDNLLEMQRKLMEETEPRGAGLRRHKTGTDILSLPEITRKPRRELTEEEKLARKKKREENAARKAKEEEEMEVRAAQRRRRKQEEYWRRHDYESCNLPMADSGDESDGSDTDERRLDIRYVSGDVTHPKYADDKDAIIVHCVDDSGRWGRGGLFSALQTRSLQPDELYTRAGKMKDLALGDAHLVGVDDLQSRDSGRDWVALIVAQHRDKTGRLSGIKLSALEQGLKRVQQYSRKHNASVHLPRIGHSTPAFNWYGTERLIRKHLAAKGTPTFIYYFPRRRPQKRRRTVSSSDEEVPAKRVSPAAHEMSPRSSSPLRAAYTGDTDEETLDVDESVPHASSAEPSDEEMSDDLAADEAYEAVVSPAREPDAQEPAACSEDVATG